MAGKVIRVGEVDFPNHGLSDPKELGFNSLLDSGLVTKGITKVGLTRVKSGSND